MRIAQPIAVAQGNIINIIEYVDRFTYLGSVVAYIYRDKRR